MMEVHAQNHAKKKQQNKLRIITEEIKHAWHK